MLFGVIPIQKYNKIKSEDRIIGPGGEMFFEFPYIPGIGIHLFRCDVNVYGGVDESNSDNNVRKEWYFIVFPDNPLFGWWGL